jgi:flagellar protein FlaG
MAMKIESVRTMQQVEPVRFEPTGVESEAIAQASTSRDKEVVQPRRALQKEKRSAEEIKKDLEGINNQLRIANRSIQFSIDEGSHDIVVRVVDKESGEVIREVPPESVIRLRERMAEISGLLVEEEV